MVSASSLVWFSSKTSGVKLLLNAGTGAGSMVMPALAGSLTPELELSALVMLVRVPASRARTSTEMAQVALAATDQALKSIALVPGAAVITPSQVEPGLAGSATTMPAGRGSLKARLLAATVLAPLSIVKVSVVIAPAGIRLAANALENSGGGSMTSVAETAGATSRPPLVKVELVLGKLPGFAPAGICTTTLNEQFASAGTLPLFSVSTPAPLRLEPAPQTPLSGRPTPASPATTLPRLSEKARPLAALAGSGLVMV